MEAFGGYFVINEDLHEEFEGFKMKQWSYFTSGAYQTSLL